MRSVTFENSTIADVLKKAARVSPKENSSAFSRAPGLYIQVCDDEDNTVIVRSTDLEVFYTQWTACVEKSEGSWEWNVTSRISNFCSTLPIGSGKYVTFSQDDEGNLRISHGRSSSKYGIIIGNNYPEWEVFEEDATAVDNFATKIEQVQWAAALGSEATEQALTGVYIDGENIVAANHRRAATIPFKFKSATERPLTIPHKVIVPVLKNSPEIKLASLKQGLGIEPDEYSQIIVTAYAENPASRMKELKTEKDFQYHLKFNTEQFTEVLNRMMESVSGAENPIIKLLIVDEKIFFNMMGKKDEVIQDVLDVAGYAKHSNPVMISFNPEDFLRAISKTPGHAAEFYYSESHTPVNFIKSGEYRAWIARKVDISA